MKIKQPRRIMKIELTPTAMQLFTVYPDLRGMTQLQVTSRLVKWFCRLPPEVQLAILQDVPAEEMDEQQITRTILKLMSS